MRETESFGTTIKRIADGGARRGILFAAMLALAIVCALPITSCSQNQPKQSSQNDSTKVTGTYDAEKHADNASDDGDTAKSNDSDQTEGVDVQEKDDPAMVRNAIDDFETRRASIEESMGGDSRMSGNMTEMREGGSDYVDSLTSLMDDIYTFLDGCIGIDSDSLATSQAAWADETSSAVESAGSQMRGSMAGLEELSVKADKTSQRIDELLDMARSLL